MNAASYSWLELGAGLKTTNVATIKTATTTSLISAPGAGKGIIIYQIDYDLGTGDSLIIGDNNAVDGTDRIIMKVQSAGSGSRQFPNGWFARANNPIQVLTTGTSVDTWIRITYSISS